MSENIEIVLAILQNEVDGDIKSALEKMTHHYSMTWMYQGKKELFPCSKVDPENEMQEIYPIKGRSYEIKNMAEGKNVVMIELIERYPDSETDKEHQTPLVLVLEMKDGKIEKGRHYCDPKLSYTELPKESIEEAYKGTTTKKLIH
jgi:ketosteroid isomerase-like protein